MLHRLVLILLSCTALFAGAQVLPAKDWLVLPFQQPVRIDTAGGQLVFSNGLLRRSFLLRPNLSCIDFLNLTTGQQLIRSAEPEARLIIDGTIYQVGGVKGQ
ncbi:MAG: alpha-galactosidase, partial [Chitinophagaceae bacterium]|nr:alpha-galactosidase [Chitinophagaceae bacterium]